MPAMKRLALFLAASTLSPLLLAADLGQLIFKDDFDRMQRECKHEKIRAERAEKARDRAEKRLDSMRIMERNADWKVRAERAETTCATLEEDCDHWRVAASKARAEVERLRKERDA